MGAFFKPDPLTGVINDPFANGFPVNDYYPLHNYTSMQLVGHGSYSNYNAFIATWQKQTGRMTFTSNYTFSKILGIRDNQTDNGAGAGNTLDPFNIRANYGVLTWDHTHIFNAAYVINLASPIKGNKFLDGVVNGWQLSGVTQLQSGAPIQPSTAGTMNVQWLQDITSQRQLGTNAIQTMVPKITCDPRNGLKSGQYFNPSCFAPPSPGSNGDVIWPYIHGPAFFNSDLAIYKNFNFKEHQKVQLRFSAFNFMNHPLLTFAAGGNGDVRLNFGTGNNDDATRGLSQTNLNAQTSGTPRYTTGRRVIEFTAKYNF